MNELIYKTEIDSQTKKTKLRLTKRIAVEKEWRGKLGVWGENSRNLVYGMSSALFDFVFRLKKDRGC